MATTETSSSPALAPWVRADLPEPPRPRGFSWIGVCGPGVIVLGMSIGSGEFLLGPATFVKHGLTLLWVTLVAVFFQTIFNTELMRYTVATGEPVVTGFMRLKPGRVFWAWFYALLYFLQIGWPAWAATAAGAIFFLFAGRLAAPPADALTISLTGAATFLACVAVLLLGRRIARTLEILNWVLVACILGGFLALALAYVPGSTWLAALGGFAGFDPQRAAFTFLPEHVDVLLLGALVGYSGGGGVLNITLSNWARDKGYGMGSRVGHIGGMLGGERTQLADTGFMFEPDAGNLERWRGWWRIVRMDQWGIFFIGALLGMMLPALLYVTFVPGGTDIKGLAISAVLANAVGSTTSGGLGLVVAALGAWILFKTQLDCVEGMTRSITDILWTGSARVRAWRGGDVRAVYYLVLAVIVAWGVIALQLAAPVMLLQIGANIAGVVFVFASLHLLYLNTRLLPPALRPPMWRRAALVAMSVFYGFFVVMVARSLTASG
ncbi:MAG TPA: Nramp family divalent metal transporter [Steroidobacteraceae bacterium]